MRWIKHMTATTQDERIASYLDDCGPSHRHEGYGFFWLLLEVVAAQIETGSEKCSATYALPTWSRLLYCHHHTVGKYLGKLVVAGLVTVKKDSGKIEVIVPNLLKYRDEYSRKSGHSQASVRSKKQIQKQIQNTETPPTPTAPDGADSHKKKRSGKRTSEQVRAALGERTVWFDELWKIGPWTDGKLEGMDAYERRVHDHDLAVKMYKGAKQYASKCAADPSLKVKYLQGWISGERWTDGSDKLPFEPPSIYKKDIVSAEEMADYV